MIGEGLCYAANVSTEGTRRTRSRERGGNFHPNLMSHFSTHHVNVDDLFNYTGDDVQNAFYRMERGQTLQSCYSRNVMTFSFSLASVSFSRCPVGTFRRETFRGVHKNYIRLFLRGVRLSAE